MNASMGTNVNACSTHTEARGVHVEKHHESHTDTGSTWPETVLVNSSIVEMDWEQFKRDRKCKWEWCDSIS